MYVLVRIEQFGMFAKVTSHLFNMLYTDPLVQVGQLLAVLGDLLTHEVYNESYAILGVEFNNVSSLEA